MFLLIIFYSRILFFASAAINACHHVPKPHMSLQCAVSALNKDGFHFQPYACLIQGGCNEAVAEYRKKFYPALQKSLACENYSDHAIECAISKFRSKHFDVYMMLMKLATELVIHDRLDQKWSDSYREIKNDSKDIYKTVLKYCKVKHARTFEEIY